VKLETAILSGFRAGIIALRSDGTVDYVNPIGSRILSTTPIAIGDNIHDKSGANQFFRLLSEALSLNYLPTRLETELPGKNGDRQVLGFTLAELRDEGAKLGICAFFKDLTHVEMAQENENLKSRLQVLGQMAASLAHEIRNPITSIGVHCGNLRSQLEENPRSLRILSAIANDVSRVESIIHECLTFVRQDTPEIRETAVDALLGELVAKFRDLHPGVSFTLSVSGQVPFLAEVDPGMLSRAVSNLLGNAADACQGKGSVEVGLAPTRHFSDLTRLDRCSDQFLPSQVELREKDYFRIRVRDDGPGMSRDVLDRIFIPFFTTKRQGTGIGLPMTQKIVHSHGGVIDLKSAPGEGTEFVIQIPTRQRHG
jgi:signal transduction histidine kinase